MQMIARKAECGSLVRRSVPLHMILFQVRKALESENCLVPSLEYKCSTGR